MIIYPGGLDRNGDQKLTSYHGDPKSRPIKLVGCIVVLLGLNLFVFWDHWRGTSSFNFDFPMSYYAFTSYWITSLQHGEWPHWIPYQSMGYPAALNPQLGLFYPAFWIFVVFRIPYTLHAANVLQALHVFFGSIGFFCFARRNFRLPVALCGAVVFGLFGGFYTNAEHPDIIRGFSWAPWLFWALLLDEPPAGRRIGEHRFLSRMRFPNLFLPLAIYCFITGVYPGLIVSGMFISAVFIVCQAAALYWNCHDRIPVFDGLMQCSQLMLGAGMAMVYLLPTGYLSRGLTRAANYTQFPPWYLRSTDFFHLFLPSNLVTTADYSMYGMQIPMVLLLFLPLARVRSSLLSPILGSAVASAMMCFESLRPLSGFITRMAPIFRLSRFPAGDYRIFIYIAVLTCAMAGIETVWRSSEAAWRNAAILFAALAALLLPCAYFLAMPVPSNGKPLLALYLVSDAAGCMLAIFVYLFFIRMKWPETLWILILTAGCIAASIPTLDEMKPFWNDPLAEATFYDQQGLPLMGRDRRLRVNSIFSRHETRRPGRIVEPPSSPERFGNVWRGYIDGSYMTSDHGGAQTVSQASVSRNPALMALMLQPGELIAVDCTPQLCADGDSDEVPLSGRSAVGKSIEYSRNSVSYEVELSSPELLVENEIYERGWRGDSDGERLAPKRIDGGLRGWVLGPGKHRLKVFYQTPLLPSAALLSLFFWLCWLISLYFSRQLTVSEQPAIAEHSTRPT